MTKRNKSKIFVLPVVAVCLVFLIMLLNPALDKRIIPANFFLAENIGFGNVEGEILFGAIQGNQTAARSIIVSNDFKKDVLISIESSGEISDHLIASENNFILIPNESREITFTIYTHGLTEYREYRGKIIIVSRRA